MKVANIVRYDGKVGVLTGIAVTGRAKCLMGSETNMTSIFVNPSTLEPVEIIDLDRDELENALALMQAFARGLVEDNEPF